jgi:demethylmenaquinone methyltransferase/2-methoxy-6-polyprenyl-1,4-benzoquinol methylase
VDASAGLAEASARRRIHTSANPPQRGGTNPEKHEGKDGSAPRFEQGDALALRFADATFDLVTIGYGLRNLRDLDGGLCEMARVTRPEGRLLVLDFAWPRNPIWRGLYALHLRTVVPLLGRVFCGEADTHAYILESLRRYPGPGEIARRMEAVGWRDVRWWGLLGGVMTIHRGRRA